SGYPAPVCASAVVAKIARAIAKKMRRVMVKTFVMAIPYTTVKYFPRSCRKASFEKNRDLLSFALVAVGLYGRPAFSCADQEARPRRRRAPDAHRAAQRWHPAADA